MAEEEMEGKRKRGLNGERKEKMKQRMWKMDEKNRVDENRR